MSATLGLRAARASRVVAARGAFVFLKNGDRHLDFLDGTVLRMRTALALLTFVVVVAVVAPRARAADFFVETVSAVDGGSSPPTTSSNKPKYQGNEVAVRCNYDAYLKVCDSSTTCANTTAHGQFIAAGKDFPVCFPTGYGQAAFLPTDAGVSTSCDFSTVTPKQTCP